MVQLLKNIIFLLAHTPGPWLLLAALVFLVIGFVMGYLIWRVSAVENNRLVRQQTRLRDEIAALKTRISPAGGNPPVLLPTGSTPQPTMESPSDDLTRLSGISPELARRLNESGIRTYSQLAELEVLTEQERQQFATTFGLPEINLDRWRWAWTSTPSDPEPTPEPVALETKDDLTVVRGITPDLMNRLNRQGVSKLSQIADWSVEEVRLMSNRLGVGRQILDERWVDQCRRILGRTEDEPTGIDPSVIDRQFLGEPVRLDPRLGVVYTRRPELLDDLQHIRGVGPMLEQELHRLGVFRFKQIGLWTSGHLKEFASKLNCDDERMERDRWVEQARERHAELYDPDSVWPVAEPGREAWQRVVDERFVGEPVLLNPPYGIIYPSAPAVSDDLVRIDGITPGSAAELRRLGIYRYEQIAQWPESTAEAVSSFLGTTADRIYRERWISQARRLAEGRRNELNPSEPTPVEATGDQIAAPTPTIEPETQPDNIISMIPAPAEPSEFRGSPPSAPIPPQGPAGSSLITEINTGSLVDGHAAQEGAVADSAFGYVFRSGRPALIDDLKLIRGVGPVEEARLQQLGIYRFWQMAGWNPAQASEVAQRGGFSGRIDRERWVPQAARLAILSDASQKESYLAPSQVDHFAVLGSEFAGEGVRLDRTLGIVYGEMPPVTDALTLIQGVDGGTESALHRSGIYRFKQIGSWSDSNVAEIAGRLGIEKQRIEREKWIPQAVNLQRVIYAASPSWAEDRPSLESYTARAKEVFPAESVEVAEDLGILYSKRPFAVDPLTAIQGVDAVIESRLHACGVFRFRQIANWSARNVDAFADLFGCHPDRIYRDRWIPQAIDLDSRRVEPPLPDPISDNPKDEGGPEVDPFAILREHFATELNVRVDRRAGIVYGDRPEIVDDLTLIEGISPATMGNLQEIGIYRFKQIAHWTASNAKEVGSVIGISPQRIEGEQWVAQARGLERQYYSASPIWASPRPSLSEYERRMTEAYADDGVGADEELGILYAGRPDLYDDLKRIDGISTEVEERLNFTGVYRFKQIADWSETNVRAFGGWLGIPVARIYQERWIGQASQLASSVPLRRGSGVVLPPVITVPDSQVEALNRDFADSPGARIDRQYGIVYDDAPEVQDDLKRLPGVTAGMEDVFRQHGVFRFKQIAMWAPQNETVFARALGMAPEQFRAADWPTHAKHLHEQTYPNRGSWGDRFPTLEEYRVRIAEVFPGEMVRADEQLGIIYLRRPDLTDDLTKIGGIEASSAARLNASGVYRFKQIANWAQGNVEAMARWIGVPADQITREDWVGQAAVLAQQVVPPVPVEPEAPADPLLRYTADPAVQWSEDLGHTFVEAPAVLDDLTRIHGIDEALAAGLNRNGVFRFWQIALWTTDVVDVLSGNLDLGNRIKRERWRPQARVLAVLGAADDEGRFVAAKEVDHFTVIDKEFADEPDVRADPRFGVVYDQRPPVSDDLCKINGVTFTLEEELHRLGVFRYKQIGNWSDANVGEVADALSIRVEDIENGKWIPQARWWHLRTYGQATRWAEPKPSVDRFEELLRDLFPGESVRVDEKFGFVYTGRPRFKDDLTRIRGINEALARKLQASGIHGFRQIAWWSDANVRAIAKRLGFHPEQVYRGQWIAQAAKLDDERPEEEVVAEVAEVVDERPGHDDGLSLHPELGPIFAERPAMVDDLKAINGVGPKLERMLNGIGVYRFSQIAGWTDTQVAAVSSRMRFRERIQREGWVEQARELASLRQAEHQETFFAPAQLDQIAVVDRELHDEAGPRVDPYLGIVFDQPPLVADDLTAIDGIGKRMERELHEAGIYRYVQIANWTDGNVTRVAENLSCLKDRIERDKWIPQARRLQRETYSASRAWGVDRPSLADYQARIEEEFPGEAVRPDAELGIVYTGWPSHVDDLKEIPGIDATTERALNLLGVYCVKQLANWSVGNVEAFAKRLATSPQRIYRDRWIFQAGGLPCKEPLPVQPVFEGLDVDLRRVLSAQPGLEADERLGFVYRERPVDVDSLNLIKGLGHTLEKQVNALGVYRFRQIASWSDPQVEEFAQRLRIGSRIRIANWVGQAREWAALSEEERGQSFVAPSVVDHDAAVEFDFANDANVRVDTQLGIVYERTPSVTDDLNLINGIGVQMERELNELGVYRFKQVARWSDANVTEFARRLFCQKERIERDKWIPQAKRLVRTVYAACPEWAGNRPAADEMDAAIRLEFAGQKVRSDKDYGIVATERPARPDDLKEISGLSGKIEQELNACGIWRFAQIARWAPTHVDALANRLQIPVDRIYRDQWIAKARRLAPLSAPPEASPAEPPRRATGTVAPRSTATVAPEPIVPAPAERPVVEPPAPRAVSPAAAPVPPPAKPDLGDTAIVIDPDLGAVYRDRPSKIDELQLIQGIGPALERRLHGYGVYRYRQIADWNRHQVEVYGDRLDVGERIHNEEWVRQAAELAEIVEAEESDDVFVAPARVDYTQVARQHFAGETGLRIDPRWGIVYDQKPELVDELRQIDGITPKLERALNRHGVYQFRQIAHWSDPTVAVFAEALALPKERIDRGKWIPQARRLELETDAGNPEWTNRASVEREPRPSVAEDFAGEDVEFDETYGVLYVAAPAQPDNLKLVKGIGTTFADRLNSVGVYKFKQIAHWTDANAEAFARLLSTKKQKIAQEGWIRQSITLDGGRRRVEPPHAERNPRPDSRQEEIVRRDLRGEDVVITPELGIIFRTPPREVDDLTKIRGIGTKVENSLNDHGVYQFRQVALWTRANAEEFSRRLEHFAGRMFREHWSDQARELHLEKYGTEL